MCTCSFDLWFLLFVSIRNLLFLFCFKLFIFILKVKVGDLLILVSKLRLNTKMVISLYWGRKAVLFYSTSTLFTKLFSSCIRFLFLLSCPWHKSKKLNGSYGSACTPFWTWCLYLLTCTREMKGIVLLCPSLLDAALKFFNC